MTSPYVDRGEPRRIGVAPAPWPAFVVATLETAGASRLEHLRLALAIAVGEGRALIDDPDGPALVAERYGLAPEQARQWHAATRFDDRPIGADELAEVRAALTAAHV